MTQGRKKSNTKLAKPAVKKEKLDPRIEKVYEEEITFMCPVRGLVKQKVKIKRFKAFSESVEKHIVQADAVVDKIENKDDGLSIYKEGDLDEGRD